MEKTYFCIDLKSFYASVECVARGLDPMTTNLVVADPERGDKTICLAITPAMKALGIRNRCRVFEIPKNVSYIMAEPRMQLYVDRSADIYAVYLEYVSPDDIHPYSIDEVFIDATPYLPRYGLTARAFARKLMDEVYARTGIRATCGIGTNLYLAKIALDITAKHARDFIGALDEQTYRDTLWEHRPLTDFWRVGPGIAARLATFGIETMGALARADEDTLYRTFGVDAELMIDHAHGREPVTIGDIKAYTPRTRCLTSGQVLMRDYTFEEGRLIVREMMDLLCLDMVDKGLVTPSVTLMVGYSNALKAEPAKGTASLSVPSSADTVLLPAITRVYEQVVDKTKKVRRMNISCNNLLPEGQASQLSLFDDPALDTQRTHKLQKTVVELKKKFGKDAVLKGMNLEAAGTTRARNHQIGGHKSGK